MPMNQRFLVQRVNDFCLESLSGPHVVAGSTPAVKDSKHFGGLAVNLQHPRL